MPGSAASYPQRLGPYELVRLLATGGMAEVYLARRDGPHGFSKTVALKRILPQLARDRDFVAMFVDEARVCAQLSHPNLVQVFDFGESGGELYMAMEYVDGTTCAKAVRRAAALGEHLPLEATLHIILSVLHGLAYAHEAVDMEGVPLGLVHRDVSPGNMLIARSGAVKLGDFGIARADDFERRTEEGQLKGKLGYMSPEQVSGRQVDARSDLFTVGIVLAELLVTRPLFGTDNELHVLMRIRDADLGVFDRHGGHLDQELRVIVRTALAKSPETRFQSAREFAEALEEYASRKRLALSASRLVTWLEHAGLVSLPRSGEHHIDARHVVRDSMRAARAASLGWNATPRPIAAVREPDQGNSEPKEQTDDRSSAQPAAPAVYRVILEQNVLGPLSYARVVELVATGRADAGTLVARGAGPFRCAKELPELARLLVSPAHSAIPDAAGCREQWLLDRGSHPYKLFEIAVRKETGLLYARQGRRQKKLFFVDGAPSFTASTDKSELLGQQLIARGMALPMEVDMALALCPRYGGRLGDALVGLGVLRPIELFRALMAQTQDRFIDLLGWSEGSLEFIRGVRAEGETILHGASSLELIAAGVLRNYCQPELEQFVERVLEQQVRPGPDSAAILKELRLPDPLDRVLTFVQQPRTVSEVSSQVVETGIAHRDQVMQALFIGLSAQVLLTTGWPPTSSQRPSVPTKPML